MKKPHETILVLHTQVVDMICNILAEHPYKIVNPILQEVVKQANDVQIQGMRYVAEEPAAAPAAPAASAEDLAEGPGCTD